ncbi:MAG: SMP-30/gluconolactonase/LRE family protein [Puniceicoccales bacterium]|jgi:sugar lactone lactonase YvrE|nr:SMP-30/gluconolactonase/LRE family protein [Puniceicoccales bacterium]
MKTTTLLNIAIAGATLAFSAGCCNWCKAPADSKADPPKLLDGKPLPTTYYSPDGMTLGTDGYVYVAINQSAGNWKYPAKIARISPDDKIEDFHTLQLHAKTKKTSPLGITFASDGNLYVSDNQTFVTSEPGLSGIIRVVIKDGKPVRDELVAVGFNAANGITQRGNYLYVAETTLGTKDKYTSGVYRIALSELKANAPLRLTGIGDPHIILTFETKSPTQKVGANGVDFDSKGNLYVNNFGDNEVRKYTFKKDGSIASSQVFARPKGAISLDGLHIDSEDNLWIADFVGNAIVKINAKTGKSQIVSQNAVPADGANGELDTPSECIRRGNKVYVSNIDLNNGPHKTDAFQTISVITLTDNTPPAAAKK